MDMPLPEGTEVKVTQTGSVSGRTKKVQATLQTLGLGRIGRTRTHKVNACLWGKLRQVNHLVRIEKA